ncbi:MAG: flagellar basal body-associated FliL family protein [Rhodobacteraceae bacterium]|nr:flagellar basal body-associated FliL family protein [Paracoccaceae bacterium]
MGKILPILLGLVGLGAGGGAGYMLRPPAEDIAEMTSCTDTDATGTHGQSLATVTTEPDAAAREYVKMNNQFVVPVVEDGHVAALVILSLNLEVALGTTEQVYAREPKLRDGFLQVLFDHANAGGFRGAFTQSNNMDVLRVALLETAQKSLGSTVSDVLIVDIVRQDS